MGTELLPWVLTSGWASGINAYAVVFVMGLLGRFFSVEAIPSVITRTDVLVVAGILTLLEVFADKIPYVDSMWDTVHTVIRPAVGATVGYLLAGHESSSLEAAFAAATGGFTALASHGVKAGIRAGINTSPEPISNVAVSSAEDLAVAGVITLAGQHPWAAAGVSGLLLVIGVGVVIYFFRKIANLKARYDRWGSTQLAKVTGADEPEDPLDRLYREQRER